MTRKGGMCQQIINLEGGVVFALLFRAAPMAYGGSQARGRIGATAAGLHHGHSHARSSTHSARPGIKPATSRFLVGFISATP